MNGTWTADDDATLVRMIGEGVSATIVAQHLGRSRSAVCGRAHRKHLHFNSHICQPAPKRTQPTKVLVRFTAAEDKIIIDMAAAGKSGLDISSALNRSKSSVIKRARHIGAKLNGKNGPKPKPKAPAVRSSKAKLHPGNIAGKKESRTHDPEFSHSTPVVDVDPLMVALVDLRPNQCRFPVSGERADTLFCGHQKDDHAYCSAHARIAYQDPQMRRRAA
jgi:hypothetical protein